MRRCRSRNFNMDARSTMLCHPENRGKGRWLPGKEWGVWMEWEWNRLGSSHPSTITSDPHLPSWSQAGGLEINKTHSPFPDSLVWVTDK